MIKKIFKKINNILKQKTFEIYEKINGDKALNKLKIFYKIKSPQKKSIELDRLAKEHYSHPLVYLNQAFMNVNGDPVIDKLKTDTGFDIESGYNQIKNYDEVKNKWIKKNSLEFIKGEFIPEQQVIGSFGNHWSLFYYLMYKLNFEKTSKPNLLIRENPKITNFALYNYFKNYLNITSNTSLYFRLGYVAQIFKTPMEFALPFKNNYYPHPVAVNFILQLIKDKGIEKKGFNFFKLSKADNEKGKELLKKMNIPENAWYVTLHIRQGKGNEYTNSNPATYFKAIKEIIKRGGYVIRVGDKSMTPINNIKGLIDYPFGGAKSQFMDIFLAATSRFCLGTSSGYWAVANIFDVPALLVNYLPALDYYSLSEKYLFLPKNLINKKTSKPIKLNEYFKFPIGYYVTNEQYEKNNIEIINNTEEEIHQATVEMLDILDKKINEEFREKNKKFKNTLDLENKNHFNHPLKAMANISSTLLNQYY